MVSRSPLWRWIDQGRLPAYRFGERRVLIRQVDLRTLITPARGEKGGAMTEIEKERDRLRRPLTKEEQKQALAAIESARQLKAQMLERHGGKLFSDSAEIVREMREQPRRYAIPRASQGCDASGTVLRGGR